MIDFYEACRQVALQMQDTCANKLDSAAQTIAICYQHELTGPISIFRRKATLAETSRFVRLVLCELRDSIMKICGGRAAIDPFDGLTDEQLALVTKTWEDSKTHPVYDAMDAVRADKWLKFRDQEAH
jgi:hypothetical protein